MTITVKASKSDVIAMPVWLMTLLNLHDGDEVKATVEDNKLRLTRLDQFLALSGVFADDEEFDRAMEFVDQAWKKWEPDAFA